MDIGSHESDPSVVLESSIKSIDWSGARLRLTLAVADGTTPTVDWSIEGPPPDELRRRGWPVDALQPGTRLDAIVAPDNRQRRSGELLHIIFTDGRTLSAGVYGISSAIPAIDLGNRLTPPAPDPLANYYGNTTTCEAEGFECRVWFQPNRRFALFSRDRQPDGSWTMRSIEGTHWIQKVDGQYIQCMLIDGMRQAPFCHSPVRFEKVGDVWHVTLASGVRETRRLLAGHR